LRPSPRTGNSAGLGYIRISNFDSQTGTSFARQLRLMETGGLHKGLILDLRDNPGGLVEEAVKVAKLIVPEGEITRLVGRGGEVHAIHYSTARGKEYPSVVLVNEESASAAEILAGALQDRGAPCWSGLKPTARLQCSSWRIYPEAMPLLLTVARYLTPFGKRYRWAGLEPDVVVEMPLLLRYHRYFLPGRLSRGDYGSDVELLHGDAR